MNERKEDSVQRNVNMTFGDNKVIIIITLYNTVTYRRSDPESLDRNNRVM